MNKIIFISLVMAGAIVAGVSACMHNGGFDGSGEKPAASLGVNL